MSMVQLHQLPPNFKIKKIEKQKDENIKKKEGLSVMENIKQLIIVRKDLEMPVGKLAAQVSHASLLSFLNSLDKTNEKNERIENNQEIFILNKDNYSYDWLHGSFAKVTLGVKNENQLLKYKKIAEENDIPFALITDEGRTCFDGEPTITCLGVGPYENDTLDKFFKKLRLY